MVIITGFFLGLFFASCLAALCTYFLFRCYGYFLCYMQIFHHRFSKNKRDDTVHHTKTSFLPACRICMTKEDMSDQASISQGIIYTLVLLLVLLLYYSGTAAGSRSKLYRAQGACLLSIFYSSESVPCQTDCQTGS